jgi:hypothetical protein
MSSLEGPGKRKALTNEYKERRAQGCVYTVTNTVTGKYLLGSAANLKSVQSHFQFAQATGSAVHPRLHDDWKALGGQAFELRILETLEQEPEQSKAEFLEDLKGLEELWRENLDLAKAY